jgi:hypothetical protein
MQHLPHSVSATLAVSKEILKFLPDIRVFAFSITWKYQKICRIWSIVPLGCHNKIPTTV